MHGGSGAEPRARGVTAGVGTVSSVIEPTGGRCRERTAMAGFGASQTRRRRAERVFMACTTKPWRVSLFPSGLGGWIPCPQTGSCAVGRTHFL